MEITSQILKCARSPFQHAILHDMLHNPPGSVRPLAAYYDSKQKLESLNALCARLSTIPTVQIYCLTDLPAYVCLRINTPYAHIENYKWAPDLLTIMTWQDQNDMDELCFEPEDILKEVLGSHYDPEEFESTKPFDESMIPWMLKCHHCQQDCPLESEEYWNTTHTEKLAVCTSCREKGLPLPTV